MTTPLSRLKDRGATPSTGAASSRASRRTITHLGDGDGTVLGQREGGRLRHPTRLQRVLDRARRHLIACNDLGEGRQVGTKCVSETVHEELVGLATGQAESGDNQSKGGW